VPLPLRGLFFKREEMNKTDYLIFGFVSLLLVGAIYYGQSEREHNFMYSCDTAEFNPDFTPAMKQQCRDLRKAWVAK